MAFDPRATSFSMDNAQILGSGVGRRLSGPARCAKWATASGFTGSFDFFDNQDTQGFVAEGNEAIIVAFRGTQPNRPMDWFVDVRATRGHWDHNIGEVHDGFYGALRKVWGVTLPNGEVLPRRLVNRGNKTIWITGHSLGGALAELCAAQAMFCSRIPVQGVYTFGQPRVGNKAFATAVNDKLGSGIYRFVNDRDIVPRVPLFTMGFCHYGNQTFFDQDGKPTDAQSAVETLAGALKFGKGVFNLAVASARSRTLSRRGTALAQHPTGPRRRSTRRPSANVRPNILRGGMEKIEDHDMETYYLPRLKTSLPQV